MSTRIRRNIHLLEVLRKASPTLRKELLKSGGNDLTKSICECVENVLNGNVKLTSAQRRKLLRHKQALRRIASSQSIGARKRYINQQGGAFLPALLAAAIPAIIQLIHGAR